MDLDITWHEARVTNESRAIIKNQSPCVLWFTGLSGSGKSTTANALDFALHKMGYHTFLLDGDNVRHGLNRDLGFTVTDRVENIRRVGEVSKLFTDAGVIVLSAFISPFASDRDLVRSLLPKQYFIEIFMNTPITICEKRDPKGLYRKARSGQLKNFTGIDSPYEQPVNPDIILNASKQSVEECVEVLLTYLRSRHLLKQLSGPTSS